MSSQAKVMTTTAAKIDDREQVKGEGIDDDATSQHLQLSQYSATEYGR